MNIAAINSYVGIPYEPGGRDLRGADCYGLVLMVYACELEILLPDFLSCKGWEDLDCGTARYKTIEAPKDFCIVRTVRSEGLADHVGIYVSGCVLSAERPCSQLVPLDRYLKKNPNTEFAVIEFAPQVLH